MELVSNNRIVSQTRRRTRCFCSFTKTMVFIWLGTWCIRNI